VVTPPPPPISPPPPPPSAAAKPTRKVERRKPATRKTATRKPARTKGERTIPRDFLDQSPPPPVGLASTQAGPAAADSGDVGGSSAVQVLIFAATALALLSLALAAVPLGALERLLAADAHGRTEQIATFVDGHRLDIVVAGVATLLAAVVVALPTVAG
jgi:hypothetical protein